MKKKTYNEDELDSLSVPEEEENFGDDQPIYDTEKEPAPPRFDDGFSKSVSIPEESAVTHWEDELPSGQVTVRLLNTDEIDGKYIIMDDEGNGYLIPKEDVKYSIKPQSIPKRALANAEPAYNWDTEIESLAISAQELREQLWREGLARQDGDVDLRSLALKLVSRGRLPVIKESGTNG